MNGGGLNLGLGAKKDLLDALLIVDSHLFFDLFDTGELFLILFVNCRTSQFFDLGELGLEAAFFGLDQLLGGTHLSVELRVGNLGIGLGRISGQFLGVRGTPQQHGLGRRSRHELATALGEHRGGNEGKTAD